MSKGLFEYDETLNVRGIRPIRGGGIHPALPKPRLSARVLCRHHNSLLSPIDAEAKKLSRFLAAGRLVENPPAAQVIDGPKIERWCLKVLIGVFAARWTELGAYHPAPELVPFVFGREQPPPAPLGLYVVENFRCDDKILGTSLNWVGFVGLGEPDVIGAIVGLAGIPFVIVSSDKEPIDTFLHHHGQFGPFDMRDAVLHHRSSNPIPLISVTTRKLRAALQFVW